MQFMKRIPLLLFILIGFLANISYGQSLVEETAEPEIIVEGFEFTEGPFWHPEGYLLFSDIPANTIYKWQPGSESASTFISPSGNSNGITWDSTQNRVVVAQHSGKISAIEDDSLKVLAEEYESKRLNSPNDVAVSSDGVIYFTDPPFGVSEEEKELEINGVYRLKSNGQVELLYDQMARPNGIVFSPDEQTLYVNDLSSGQILSFDVTSDGNVSLPNKFASVGAVNETGAADGMVVDSEGRLYSTGPGGIYVFSPQGQQLEKIALPVRATNLEWGPEGESELYISTPNAIYRLQMNSRAPKK